MPIRTTIVIANKNVEQLSHFNYLGCDLTYKYENNKSKNNNNNNNKKHNFHQICFILIKNLKRKTSKETMCEVL